MSRIKKIQLIVAVVARLTVALTKATLKVVPMVSVMALAGSWAVAVEESPRRPRVPSRLHLNEILIWGVAEVPVPLQTS